VLIHKVNVWNCDFRIMALILMMWVAPVKHSDACAEADTVVIRRVQVRSQF
jgi:hypothetical protein